jgi:ADP-heptose:LPS heptosyltransferase
MIDYFSEFDLVISYLYDPDQIFRTNVRRCSPAQFVQGRHRPENSEGLHATQVFLRALEPLAIFDADPVPRLRLGESARCENRLALHPGSGGGSRKNWPEKKWAEFIERLLNETGWELVIAGGPAEEEILQRLSAALPLGRVMVERNRPLPVLAKTLQNCRGFVGHDSGITHLASALGLPVVVLWGQSDRRLWQPPGEGVRVLHHADGLDELPVELVFEAAKTLVQG